MAIEGTPCSCEHCDKIAVIKTEFPDFARCEDCRSKAKGPEVNDRYHVFVCFCQGPPQTCHDCGQAIEWQSPGADDKAPFEVPYAAEECLDAGDCGCPGRRWTRTRDYTIDDPSEPVVQWRDADAPPLMASLSYPLTCDCRHCGKPSVGRNPVSEIRRCADCYTDAFCYDADEVYKEACACQGPPETCHDCGQAIALSEPGPEDAARVARFGVRDLTAGPCACPRRRWYKAVRIDPGNNEPVFVMWTNESAP